MNNLPAVRCQCPTCKYHWRAECLSPVYRAMPYEAQKRFWEDCDGPCRLYKFDPERRGRDTTLRLPPHLRRYPMSR